ncbi:putative serine protease HhoA [Planktothrix rubescens CCAP 1459/22]|uniref:Serine protease HhoA n=2 Tax=Microcoleaceae TaxID=1892252 RepID=A0A6J7ZIW4_PLARU|nr:putative serine protease HhoA [Planktothrix rubescens NIVA-CYA 18]CAD5928158.1 Putative serine protease HhoA [Planktothrix rubescens NIVA-CYA 18]
MTIFPLFFLLIFMLKLRIVALSINESESQPNDENEIIEDESMEKIQPKTVAINSIISYLLVAVLSVVLTLISLQIFPHFLITSAQAEPILTQTQPPTVTAISNPNSFGNFVSVAVNKVGPAVVRIDTERTVSANISEPFFDDPFFRRFFGEGMPQTPQEYQQRGQGSGFIIDSSGIILTNSHVIKGVDKVTVTLKDGRQFQGEVRGSDDPSDLAVIKINGNNLPVAPLGNSSEVQVGDWAIAVGNPLGLDNTVTLGIVSTLNRPSSQVGIPDKRLDFIQTDAAINPGNSGGPLLNAQGEVIGINTAIRADGQGIGFAIPIDAAKTVEAALVRGEKIAHPYIGIRMATLTADTAKQLNNDPNSLLLIPEFNGVLVVQIIPKSPAGNAGLRRGDVITEIDGQAISSADQLQRLVEKSKIGQPLKITLHRGQKTEQISVRPSQLDEAALR